MCGQLADDLSDGGICLRCRDRYGIPDRSPPLRPPRPCERCAGTQFVRSRSIRERGETNDEANRGYIAPLSLTFNVSKRNWLFSNDTVEPDLRAPAGLLEAYTCRKCGFTEFYAHQPDEIPIDEMCATELYDVGAKTPFR